MKTEILRYVRITFAAAILLVGFGYSGWLLLNGWFLHHLNDLAFKRESYLRKEQMYRSVLSESGSVDQRLSAATNDQRTNSFFLATDDPSIGASELTRRLMDIVTSQNKDLGNCSLIQSMPVTLASPSAQRHSLVKVRASLACDLRSLVKVLNNLEYGRPYVQIEKFSVQRARSPKVLEDSPLEVDFVIFAYLRPSAVGSS